MPRKHNARLLLVVSLLLVAAAALVLTSCSREGSVSSPTSSGGSNVASALSAHNPNDVALAMRVQNAHTPELMKIPDVVGTGTGVGANGRLAVLVLTRKPGVGNIPASVDGIQTEVREVGDVVPYAKPGGSGQRIGLLHSGMPEYLQGTPYPKPILDALTAGLAAGRSLPDAIARAKKFVTASIANRLRWKSNSGANIDALNHSSDES